MIVHLYTLQIVHHDKLSTYLTPYSYYNIVDYITYAVHYIPVTFFITLPPNLVNKPIYWLFFIKWPTLRDAKLLSRSIPTTPYYKKSQEDGNYSSLLWPWENYLRIVLLPTALSSLYTGKIKWDIYWRFFEHLGPEELQKAKVLLFSYPLFLLPLVLASLKNRTKLAITFCLIKLHVVETAILKQIVSFKELPEL